MDTVPIVVDSIKRGMASPNEMVRCIYFSIECSEPTAGWEVRYRESIPLPLLMLNLSGIVLHPFDKPQGFTHPDDIAGFIGMVEKASGPGEESPIYFDVNDLWIPGFLMRPAELPGFDIGAVYRVAPELFRRLYAYRNGRDTLRHLAEYAEIAVGEEPLFAYSAPETTSFEAWRNLVIEDARSYHRQDSELKLCREKSDTSEESDSPGMR